MLTVPQLRDSTTPQLSTSPPTRKLSNGHLIKVIEFFKRIARFDAKWSTYNTSVCVNVVFEISAKTSNIQYIVHTRILALECTKYVTSEAKSVYTTQRYKEAIEKSADNVLQRKLCYLNNGTKELSS